MKRKFTHFGVNARLLMTIVVFALFILLATSGFSRLSKDTIARQKQALADAITRDVSHCYILEGRYPESLDYLKQNYELIYDESRFFVDYRIAGTNLLPTVTIIERRA